MESTKQPRTVYRAKHTARCPVCDTGIRRGMPIVFVPARGRFHDYPSAAATVAIHAVCERLHSLAT